MKPEIIKDYELIVAGIEMQTRNSNLGGDMARLGEQAEAQGLAESIRHRTHPHQYMALLWGWSADDDFPLMSGAEITSTEDQPTDCVIRRFPRCDYARIPMQGVIPNLQEPWPEIQAWYPLDISGMTTTVRVYDESSGTGELLIPLAPALRPELVT